MFSIESKIIRVVVGFLFVGGLVVAVEHRVSGKIPCTPGPGCAFVLEGGGGPFTGCSNTTTGITWGQDVHPYGPLNVTLTGGSTYWSYQCTDIDQTIARIIIPGTGSSRGTYPPVNKGACDAGWPILRIVNCGGGASGFPLCNTKESWKGDCEVGTVH